MLGAFCVLDQTLDQMRSILIIAQLHNLAFETVKYQSDLLAVRAGQFDKLLDRMGAFLAHSDLVNLIFHLLEQTQSVSR